MTERRFQLGLSAVLLVATLWYVLEMVSYPSHAGRVPTIVALVMGGALVLQIVGQLRALRAPSAPARPDAVPPEAEVPRTSDDPLAYAEERVQEVEEATSGFGVLLALDSVRRRRFIEIALFSILFFVGALMVGFVLTTGFLIFAFLLVARERLVVALAAGLLSAGAVYLLVVVVIELPALDGYLF
jgi:hypothetical protein